MSAVEFVLLVVKDGDIAFCFKNVIKVQGFCYFMTKTLHKLLNFIFLKKFCDKNAFSCIYVIGANIIYLIFHF